MANGKLLENQQAFSFEGSGLLEWGSCELGVIPAVI